MLSCCTNTVGIGVALIARIERGMHALRAGMIMTAMHVDHAMLHFVPVTMYCRVSHLSAVSFRCPFHRWPFPQAREAFIPEGSAFQPFDCVVKQFSPQ